MKSDDGGSTPFPVDEVGLDKAIFGRTTDDLIFMVMPPSVLGVTYMLLVVNHLSASCEFVNGLAYHMLNDDVQAADIVSDRLVKAVTDSLLERHGITELHEGIVKRGTPELFEGMYYAEIHPIELAGVGVVINEIRDSMPLELRTPIITAILDMWSEAERRFVNDNERLALVITDAGVA